MESYLGIRETEKLRSFRYEIRSPIVSVEVVGVSEVRVAGCGLIALMSDSIRSSAVDGDVVSVV